MDIDITPFYKELGKQTFCHIARFSFYMTLVALGALAAFLYISQREERDLSLEREDNDGDSGQDD